MVRPAKTRSVDPARRNCTGAQPATSNLRYAVPRFGEARRTLGLAPRWLPHCAGKFVTSSTGSAPATRDPCRQTSGTLPLKSVDLDFGWSHPFDFQQLQQARLNMGKGT